VSTAYAQGTISTVGFIAGGVLAAAGVTLFLFARAPKGGRETPSPSAALMPMVGPGAGAGGLQIAGGW